MSTFILNKNNKNEILGRLRKALFNNNRTNFKVTIRNKEILPCYTKLWSSSLEGEVKVDDVMIVDNHVSNLCNIQINIKGFHIMRSTIIFNNNKVMFSGGNVIIDSDDRRTTFSPIKFDKRKCYYYDERCENKEKGTDGCCTCVECFYLAKCRIAKERCTPEQRKFYGMEE